MELIEQFRTRSARMVVVDEYGVVQGLMTPLTCWKPSPANCNPMPGGLGDPA